MSFYTVHVSNISPATTEQQLVDFFTFCGKIHHVEIQGTDKKTAEVHFEKPSAAHTALMLNGGTLDGSQLVVTSETVHPAHDPDSEPHHGESPYSQSDKPRAGIAAEYLAKGYVLSDQILQRAIEIDNKQGISKRFLGYFSSIDKTLGEKAIGPDATISGRVQAHLRTASEQAKSIDEQKGISKTANDYYSRAISSSFGQKVLSFYTNTSKQVLDIHEEATRIAGWQKPTDETDVAPPSGEPTSIAPAPTTAPPTSVV